MIDLPSLALYEQSAVTTTTALCLEKTYPTFTLLIDQKLCFAIHSISSKRGILRTVLTQTTYALLVEKTSPSKLFKVLRPTGSHLGLRVLYLNWNRRDKNKISMKIRCVYVVVIHAQWRMCCVFVSGRGGSTLLTPRLLRFVQLLLHVSLLGFQAAK